MSKRKVTYSRGVRQRALKERKGLVTIEVMFPGKEPGTFGPRITMQGPADVTECDTTAKTLAAFIDRAAGR